MIWNILLPFSAAQAVFLQQQGGGDFGGSGFGNPGNGISGPGVDLGTIAAGASAAEGLLHAAAGVSVDPRHNIPEGPYHRKKK